MDILIGVVKTENFNTSIDKVMATYMIVENMKNVLANLQHKRYYKLKKAPSDKDDIKTKWLVYSIETQLCGIIEKNLRNSFFITMI